MQTDQQANLPHQQSTSQEVFFSAPSAISSPALRTSATSSAANVVECGCMFLKPGLKGYLALIKVIFLSHQLNLLSFTTVFPNNSCFYHIFFEKQAIVLFVLYHNDVTHLKKVLSSTSRKRLNVSNWAPLFVYLHVSFPMGTNETNNRNTIDLLACFPHVFY